MWSCSKPSQPLRARFWMRYASATALPKCTKKYGLVRANAATQDAAPIATRRHCPHAATTSGTSRNTPGYLKLVARPAATPASSIRPVTSSASDAATPRVSGTSVTAMREYATCVVSTATQAAATGPASPPYARLPSHQVAATAPTASATTTSRAVRYEGCAANASNGASKYISSDG